MLIFHNYKTLTKAENTWHRNEVFPGEKKTRQKTKQSKLLKVTEQTSFLAWMESNNCALKTGHLLALMFRYHSDKLPVPTLACEPPPPSLHQIHLHYCGGYGRATNMLFPEKMFQIPTIAPFFCKVTTNSLPFFNLLNFVFSTNKSQHCKLHGIKQNTANLYTSKRITKIKNLRKKIRL